MTDPLVPDPQSAPPIRWGILAAGGIANKFARAVADHTASTVTAVGSRDLGRARAFAAAHGIAAAAGSYQELVERDDVDAVYVASPHSHHLEHARLALGAGKHVLVEKALARNLGEVDGIFAAASERDRFAMEAMWTRHLPHIAMARRWIDQGRIGQIVSITADHGQSLDLPAEHRVKNPDLAGGALLDLAVYPVAFIVDLLGEPEQIEVVGQLAETGVDASSVIAMRFADPAVAQASSTLKAKTPTTAIVCGTEGRIEIDGDFYSPNTMALLSGGRSPELLERFDGRIDNGFQFEAAEAARCIAAGAQQSERMTWASSRAVIGVLDTARAALGVRYPGE